MKMKIDPKVRGFICTTAHPIGCANNAQEMARYVKEQGEIAGPKNVLIIGHSTGYGFASRMVAALASKAKTLGVAFEREASGNRTASPGWYNDRAFLALAQKEGLYAKTLFGDAFSNQTKEQTIELIKQDFQEPIDLVIYSLASPRRQDPETEEVYSSVLKPIGQTFINKTVNVLTGEVTQIEIPPATEEEIEQTVKVMGGEDWQLWIEALLKQNLLAKNVITVAYSYIGPEITHAVYRNGTIGKAKEHLEHTALELDKLLQQKLGGHAYISVNKALVTQASAAIPVVPLYISLLYKVMKEKGLHEGCIEQIYRLFKDRLYGQSKVPVDEAHRIRIDDWEMRDDVQEAVKRLWQEVSTENLEKLSDIEGYRQEFYRLFGFNRMDVDYSKEVAIDEVILGS